MKCCCPWAFCCSGKLLCSVPKSMQGAEGCTPWRQLTPASAHPQPTSPFCWMNIPADTFPKNNGKTTLASSGSPSLPEEMEHLPPTHQLPPAPHRGAGPRTLSTFQQDPPLHHRLSDTGATPTHACGYQLCRAPAATSHSPHWLLWIYGITCPGVERIPSPAAPEEALGPSPWRVNG